MMMMIKGGDVGPNLGGMIVMQWSQNINTERLSLINTIKCGEQTKGRRKSERETGER